MTAEKVTRESLGDCLGGRRGGCQLGNRGRFEKTGKARPSLQDSLGLGACVP